MGSTKASTVRRVSLLAAGIAGLAVLAGLFIWWWSRPPQMGADEEVSRTVDALFTAVTARDEKLLADCERRLLSLKNAEKLPPEASAYLDLPKQRIYKLSAAGAIPHVKQAGRLLFDRVELDQWLRKQPKARTAATP